MISKPPREVLFGSPASPTHRPSPQEMETLLEEIISGQTIGLLLAATWTELSARTGYDDGSGAEVLDADGGTHLQATGTGYDGASVANAGRYRYDTSWDRWVRLGETGLSSKADEADLGTAAAADADDFATAAQGQLADTAAQSDDLGTAAAADTDDFATAAQGTLATSAAQSAEFYPRSQNIGGRLQLLPDGQGGSGLDYNAKTRQQETPFPLVSRHLRQNDGGMIATKLHEERTVAGMRGGQHVSLMPLHATQRLALLADTHGVQQLFLLSENENLGTNWARQLTFAPRPVTGYDWVRVPTMDVPGLVQFTVADQPAARRRHRLGRVEVPIVPSPVRTTPTKVLMILNLGQSNSQGAVGGYMASRVALTINDLMVRDHSPYSAISADLLRFNGGVIPHQNGPDSAFIETAIDTANIASFVPLREGDNASGEDRETYLSALALHLNGPNGYDRSRYILAGSFGFGGSSFEELILDGSTVQQPYQNALDAVQSAQDICDGLVNRAGDDAPLEVEVVVVWDQGEADANTAAATYRDYMTDWHSDLVTRIGAITGQSTVKLFLSQTVVSRGSGGAPCLSAFGQALAAAANSDIHLLPVSYFTDPDEDPYRTPGSVSVIHQSPVGHRWRGAIYGEAMARVLVDDTDPGLRILSATWSGDEITITWNQSDVVIDRDTIQNLSVGLGLSHINSNGATRSITRVYMAAPNQTVIRLSDDIPAEAVETVTVGGSDIEPNGNWIFGYAKGPRSAFRRRDPIGYSMISGEPLFVFANIEEFSATEV